MNTQADPGLRRLRERTADALFAVLPQDELAAAERCAARLRAELPDQEDLRRNVVLVAYGGGKDSSYTIAFVRAVQLILFRQRGTTFRIRVATNRHSGMPQAVMENIDRTYRALGLFDDADCQMLTVDGAGISDFRVDAPQPRHLMERDRADILMTGHRTFAEARPTFCNSCNVRMVDSFALAACHGEVVDLIVTGDSREEQRAYAFWVHRLSHRFGRPAARSRGFGGFVRAMTDLSDIYYRDIHGSVSPDRAIDADALGRLSFFSIYDETEYSAGNHWELLTDFLHFSFDDLAFSFTESDCGNPLLMAHIRGLKCERLYGRDYAEGIREYVDFAVELMRRKEFPPVLIDAMIDRYSGQAAICQQRARANRFAWDAYRITQQHLVCMAYSPFADGMAGLDTFLLREHSFLWKRRADIRAMVADHSACDPDLARELLRISGLTVPQIRILQERPLMKRADDTSQLLGAVLDGDPHKAVIKTRHSPGGPLVAELISGR